MLARPSGIAAVTLKTEAELELMAQSGEIVREVLTLLREMVAPGVSTKELDKAAETHIRSRGGEPAFLGFRGYPASICASINHEVVHGIPQPDKKIKATDIISLDVGVRKNGYYGDAAITVAAAEASGQATELIKVTEDVLKQAIEQVQPGNRIGDISHVIQQYVEARGFSVVRDFVGHGIGSQMHEPPQIPNFGPPGRGVRLKVGMVLAIEPMVNVGGYDVRTLADNWTVVTCDGSLSAHFEHCVAVTKDGPRVLTR